MLINQINIIQLTYINTIKQIIFNQFDIIYINYLTIIITIIIYHNKQITFK